MRVTRPYWQNSSAFPPWWWLQILAGGPGAATAEIRLPADWDELMQNAGYRPLREFYLD